jgi:hypothetical protein
MAHYQSIGGITILEDESYLDKLAKMIPGESVAAFLAIKAYLGMIAENEPRWYWFAVAGGLIVCIIFRGFLSAETNKKWNVPLLVLSIVAYIFWAGNIISGPFTGQLWQAVSYLGLIIMSLVGPELYRMFNGPVKSRGPASS